MTILLLFLAIDYLRPQDFLPLFGALKIQTAILVLLFLTLIVHTTRHGFHLARLDRLVLVFLALAVITVPLAYNRGVAFNFAYGLVLTLVPYFAITHFVTDLRDYRRILGLLALAHMFLGAKAIVGYSSMAYTQAGHTSTFGLSGAFLSDENDLALSLNIALPLAYYLAQQSRTRAAHVFWATGSAIILYTIFLTFSRGGFLGLAAMIVFWVATRRNKLKAIAMLLVVAALAAAVMPPRYWDRIQTIADTDEGTAQGRKDSWKAATRMFLDSPLFGVGGNNFAMKFPEYALELPPAQRGTMWGRATHSLYYQLLSEFGMAGVSIIGFLIASNTLTLWTAVRSSRRGESPPSLGQLADSLRLSWIGFLASATFISVLTYPHLYYLTAFSVLIHRLRRHSVASPGPPPPNSDYSRWMNGKSHQATPTKLGDDLHASATPDAHWSHLKR